MGLYFMTNCARTTMAPMDVCALRFTCMAIAIPFTGLSMAVGYYITCVILDPLRSTVGISFALVFPVLILIVAFLCARRQVMPSNDSGYRPLVLLPNEDEIVSMHM